MATRVLNYRLGRNCVFIVDGTVLKSVTDAFLRVRVTTQDATGPGNHVSSDIVIRRDISFEFVLLDVDEAQFLDGKVAVPGTETLVLADVQQGHVSRSFLATIHECSEQQGLADVVNSQWEIRQWGQRTV